MKRRQPGAQCEPAQQEQHRDGQGEGRSVAHQDGADGGQIGVPGRGVDESQADHDERARDSPDNQQSQTQVWPPQRDQDDGRGACELEAGPQPDQVGRGGGDHDPERRQERHRQAEVERVLGRPVGGRERDGGCQQRRSLGKQREPILHQRAAEVRRQRRAGPQLDAQRDQDDERRRLGKVARGNPAEAAGQHDEDRGRDDQRLWQQNQVSHCEPVAPGDGTGATYGDARSEMPAVIWFRRPGSNRGTSVPGILGPPGNRPTHSRPPASRPRYHVSLSEESDTPGASLFGAPKSTLRSNTASAIALMARPAATANAPIGWFLNAPKKVMSSATNDARIGTPSKARAAIVSSHARFGIRGARPLSTLRLRDWARSESVAHTPAMRAAASPPVNRLSTLPAIPSGETAARPSTVMPPGTMARYAPACRTSTVRNP